MIINYLKANLYNMLSASTIKKTLEIMVIFESVNMYNIEIILGYQIDLTTINEIVSRLKSTKYYKIDNFKIISDSFQIVLRFKLIADELAIEKFLKGAK